MAKDIGPMKGIFPNKKGGVLTIRVKSPITAGVEKKCSLGTREAKLANKRYETYLKMREQTPNLELIDLIAKGEIDLVDAITASDYGDTKKLLADREEKLAVENDPDLDQLLYEYRDTYLASNFTPHTRATYYQELRFLVPEGKPFPMSKLTRGYMAARIDEIRHPYSGKAVSNTTKHHYAMAARTFCRKWLIELKELMEPEANPFLRDSWVKKQNDGGLMTWDYETVLVVMNHIKDREARAALALAFGAGFELSGLQGMRVSDVWTNSVRQVQAPAEFNPDGERAMKNGSRGSRVVTVRTWAWKYVRDFAKGRDANEILLPNVARNSGKWLRDIFYHAQADLKLCDAPKVEKKSRKLGWGKVKKHKLHDCRKTFCTIAFLGQDGDVKFDTKDCAAQLGHGSEQMVLRVYLKGNIKQRLLLQAEAVKQRKLRVV